MKDTIIIVKSSPWKYWNLSKNHPEYAAILKIIRANASKYKLVLVGTTTEKTEALKLGDDIIAWDLHRTVGITGQLTYFINLFTVILRSKPSKIIALGLLNLFPISVYLLFSRKARFAPFFIGEFGYFGKSKIGKIMHAINIKLLSIALNLSSEKISNAFTLSNYTRNLIEQLSPGLKNRIKIISYPISEVFLAKPNVNYKNATEPIVLCVAGIEPRKGLDILVKAFSLVEVKAQLIIKGSVRDQAYFTNLNRVIEELNLSEKVKLDTQALEYDDLVDLYRKSTVFVFPTLDDCLGVVVLEALHSKLPVVASNVGGVPEMVQDGVNGYLVPPKDVTKLADAITKVLSEPSVTKNMSECSLDTLNKKYYVNRLSLLEALDLSVKN
jgi:glycosyltransferase involved in cell wall biosynthesis